MTVFRLGLIESPYNHSPLHDEYLAGGQVHIHFQHEQVRNSRIHLNEPLHINRRVSQDKIHEVVDYVHQAIAALLPLAVGTLDLDSHLGLRIRPQNLVIGTLCK